MTAEHALAQAFVESRPSHAAMVLERMSPMRTAAVLRVITPGAAGLVCRDMTPVRAARCLAQLASEEAGPILAAMSAVDVIGILRTADPDARERLLAAIDGEARIPLVRALSHRENTAGAVMDPSIFQLTDDVLIADARTRLRAAARDLLYYVYVTDRDHRLVGVLDIPELMLARARDPVGRAMHRDVDRLSVWMPVALVREHPGWHRYHALPVVDDADRLVGAIRYQTLRRLERDAAGRAPDPSLLTARALGELFQLGTTGLVAGVAVAATGREPDEHGVEDDLATLAAGGRDAG
jgi:magnesium transporter